MTARTISKFIPGCEYVDMTGSTYNYWKEVCKRWTGEETLIVLEQDLEFTAEVLPSFESCSKPWCTFAYNVYETEETIFSLGCAKFTAEAQRMFTPKRIGHGNLDVWIYSDFHDLGIEPHVHGHLNHLHDYSDLPEVTLKQYQASCKKFKRRIETQAHIFGDYNAGSVPDNLPWHVTNEVKSADLDSLKITGAECNGGRGPMSIAEMDALDPPPEKPVVLIRDEDGSWMEYHPDKHDYMIPYLNSVRRESDE